MRQRLTFLADPMVAVLVLATLAAIVLPVTGEARGVARIISNVGIFLLFLLNGMRIARGEILRGFVNWRFFLPLFIWVFGVMALAGLGASKLALASALPPAIALGFIYLGVLPTTIQSATSYTNLANGNIALAVVGAALFNIAGVFVTAPLFALLAGGEVADLGIEVIVRIGMILILPFMIGQAVQGWTRDWVLERKQRIVWLDRAVIGLAVYVAFSGAIEQGLGDMLDMRGWAWLFGMVLCMLVLAHVANWLVSKALGYPFADRITFLFSGAQKSVAIGAPLAAILFKPDIAGFVIAPLLIYHLAQLVLAAPLSSWLARHPQA